MAEREVLEGDGGSAGEEGAQEGAETHHENYCGTPASGISV
jgi:hypothetical protein